jgi:hypothetical protein
MTQKQTLVQRFSPLTMRALRLIAITLFKLKKIRPFLKLKEKPTM